MAKIKYNKNNFSSKKDFDCISRLEKMLKRPISIPGEYLLNGGVNSGAKIFWQFLNLVSNIDGESWWKQETIAKVIGLSETSIKRHLRDLQKAGWLIKKKRKKGQSNIYTLVWPESCPNPRISGAKKNSIMEEMKDKIDGRQNRRYYRNNSNGPTKAFE